MAPSAHIRSECALMLILFVFSLTLLLGTVGLANDIGLSMHEKRRIQHGADVTALDWVNRIGYLAEAAKRVTVNTPQESAARKIGWTSQMRMLSAVAGERTQEVYVGRHKGLWRSLVPGL